jgi:NAD(P)-dependent dehydrogenase (short-subunit alcohol dehydrogenase family)
LQAETPTLNFQAYQLDITDNESIVSNVEKIREKEVRFDVIVVNAGFGWDKGDQIPSEETARKTLHINVNSTIMFIKSFLPLLALNGRLIIISSVYGSLESFSKSHQEKLTNPKITEAEIYDFVEDYIACAVKKDMGEHYWSAYGVSKALMNCWTRFILP